MFNLLLLHYRNTFRTLGWLPIILILSLPAYSAEGGGSTITLTPAVVMLEARSGQTATQTFTVDNHTPGRFSFELAALDVVVRNGTRTFVDAGETSGGIAQTAVFTPRFISLEPGQSASVLMTVTVPESPQSRAIVAMFRGTTAVAFRGGIAITGSIGALVTFTLSKQFHIENSAGGEVRVSSGKRLSLSQPLVNNGAEPVVPKGIVAILNAAGTLVGKIPVTGQRLLPGEKGEFKAEYPTPLNPGKYRALTSLKYEGGVFNTSADFVVP
jgi:hypothetical protein